MSPPRSGTQQERQIKIVDYDSEMYTVHIPASIFVETNTGISCLYKSMHGSFHTMQHVISCSPYNAQMVGIKATDQMLVINQMCAKN